MLRVVKLQSLINSSEFMFTICRPNCVYISTEQYHKLYHYQIVAEPENKAAALGSPNHLAVIHNRKYRNGVSSLMVLEEKVQNLYFGRVHKPSCPFFENFQRKTAQLYESGILNNWVQTEFFPKGTKPRLEPMKPQVLTMEHLDICFIVFSIPLTVTILLFAMELFISRLLRR